MTNDELTAIEARANAATAGPWTEGVGKVRAGETRELIIGADDRTIVAMAYGGFGHPVPDCTSEDRRFIAHAREDVPALVAEVRRLREERDAIMAAYKALTERDGWAPVSVCAECGVGLTPGNRHISGLMCNACAMPVEDATT